MRRSGRLTLSSLPMNDMQTSSGLLLDDPRVLESLPSFDILFGSGEETKPVDWRALMPKFRWQGPSMWCTAYAATNIGSAFNKKETGKEILFSPYELFYRTGGSRWGNTLVNAAAGMCQGFVLEEDKPTEPPNFWNDAVHTELKEKAVASPEALDRGKPYAMKGFSVVSPTKTMLKKALEFSPVMLAIGLGQGYWNVPAPRRSSYSAYHCVTLDGITEDGEYEILESLTPRSGYNGRHMLASDYEILYALSFVDLPNDWHTVQEASKKKDSIHALAQYGERRNLALEIQIANLFSIEIKKHPTLTHLAGRYWTVIVNALAYGGYSTQDILNHLTNIRRTGSPIFDLNAKRVKN